MAAESSAVRTEARKSIRRPDAVLACSSNADVTVRLQRTEIPATLRRDMIEQAAYFRAATRGFAPGRELDDWLEAEREIDRLIRIRYP